ncbi:MAG: UvrD-helicase domain-containing protein [Gemmatimonadetes bacterium]|nr:UvrD-helicase domain-containing protein [Gemmatimonadota bacterium]NNM04061.1 UvrD-helicase domain-containing protein [Gemmatimonadota bacterium]
MTSPLPRELVLASAGSGKTHHLSSRLIGLLAMDVPPETIWASTFTRKAAAEILERVLVRLAEAALDEGKAAKLAEDAWLGEEAERPGDFLTRSHCGRLLTDLIFSLHRANIGTLDSFFVQMAKTFARELGISPTWRMVEGPEEDRMRSEALEAVLDQKDSGVMAELVRVMAKGEVRRGVHRHLLEQVEKLLEALREVAKDDEEAWTLRFPDVEVEGAPDSKQIQERCQEIAELMAARGEPGDKVWAPNSYWEKELRRLAEVVRIRNWKEFFRIGIGKKLVETEELIPAGEVKFRSHHPDPGLADLLDETVFLARLDLAREIKGQAAALERLAGWYRDAFEEAQRGRGDYRFGDITHLLRSHQVMSEADSLYFRLDAHVQHVLLDEFQDTSQAQWEVLDPLVDELLSGHETERAAVVVADPKQSIYGWRGARPSLVNQVRETHRLEHGELDLSYRSGPVILDVVKDVFSELNGNPVVGEMDGGPEVAEQWIRDFYRLDARWKDRPGYAELRVGPPAAGMGGIQPAVLRFAAEFIGDLHQKEPRASIGVLVRTNKVVSYLIAALRELGIPASGEGGTPLTDAAPVNAILALLRMVDHPGDKLARYHVAKTPVGEVVGYTDYDDLPGSNRLARRIRGQLMRDGYGVVLGEWAKDLDASCHTLERARLLQLVEMGFGYDAERTLRPRDFVRLVEKQRVEDPSGAQIRVMTIHQSKGLQFDVVVLPHLYQSVEQTGFGDPVVPWRDEDSGRITRVYPATNKTTRTLLPELRPSHDQNRAFRLRDDFSGLYVALTRTRYALHMLIPADGERGEGTTKSSARILRNALAPGDPADEADPVLYSHGDPDWFEKLRPHEFSGGAGTDAGQEDRREVGDPVPLRPTAGARVRNLARRSPSAMEGGETLDLATHLQLDLKGDARLRGTVVHAWCEAIGWIEDGIPDDATLSRAARKEAPGLSDDRIQEWLDEFKAWMESPAIQKALSREAYSPEARVEQELPFVQRVPDGILQGYIDRLVVWREDGDVVGAEVLDFKTDVFDASDPDAVEAKITFYRPQIDAYRSAVAVRYGLEPSAVSGKLLFLRPGVVKEV